MGNAESVAILDDALVGNRGEGQAVIASEVDSFNAMDQHAAAGDVDFRKRMTGGYVASNCSTALSGESE